MKEKDNEKHEVAISFMVEDLKDTSEHLRATDKKTEFLFQLFFGGSVALVSAGLVFIQKLLEKDGTKGIAFILITSFLILLLGLSVWVFELVVRGYSEKIVYVNRMNFLRKKIYSYGNINLSSDKEMFLFTGKQSTSRRLGSGVSNWFLVALYISFFILPVAIGVLSHIYYEVSVAVAIPVPMMISISLILLMYWRWKIILDNVDKKLDQLWK